MIQFFAKRDVAVPTVREYRFALIAINDENMEAVLEALSESASGRWNSSGHAQLNALNSADPDACVEGTFGVSAPATASRKDHFRRRRERHRLAERRAEQEIQANVFHQAFIPRLDEVDMFERARTIDSGERRERGHLLPNHHRHGERSERRAHADSPDDEKSRRRRRRRKKKKKKKKKKTRATRATQTTNQTVDGGSETRAR